MTIRKILQELRGDQTWRKFHQLTGISCGQLWKMEHQGHALPPQKTAILCELAKKQGWPLSQKEIITLLLGGELACRLADLDLLMEGRTLLDTWIRQSGSQRSQVKILGLHYSTIFHHRSRRFKRFWPKRAVEIARRSNYEIDLLDLLGIVVKRRSCEKDD